MTYYSQQYIENSHCSFSHILTPPCLLAYCQHLGNKFDCPYIGPLAYLMINNRCMYVQQHILNLFSNDINVKCHLLIRNPQIYMQYIIKF